MRRPFLIRLRPTLLTTIVGLVLLTALTIGGGAAILTLSVTRTLIDQARTDAVTAAREETRQLFDEPPRIARQLAAAAHRGALPLDDRQKLTAILAEVLRNWPRLAVVGYGNIDGDWYIGCTAVSRWRRRSPPTARSPRPSRAIWTLIRWLIGLGSRQASRDQGQCGRRSTGSPPVSLASPA
jgi:hypothetical protein